MALPDHINNQMLLSYSQKILLVGIFERAVDAYLLHIMGDFGGGKNIFFLKNK